MNHSTLLAACYSNYNDLLREWGRMLDTHENIGAFVFMPEGYVPAKAFNDVHYEFWPMPEVQAYLKVGKQV